MATPAEPVKPVSQASRFSDAGRYSFCCAIGVRHDPAGEPAAGELGAQRRHPRAACPAFGAILERLEAGLEHRGNLWRAR